MDQLRLDALSGWCVLGALTVEVDPEDANTRRIDQLDADHRRAVVAAVRALCSGLSARDVADAVQMYEADRGMPAPYRDLADLEARWALHPMTLALIDSEDLELHLVLMRAPDGVPHVSVYAGNNGYVVALPSPEVATCEAVNVQGSIGYMVARPDDPYEVLPSVWSALVDAGWDGFTGTFGALARDDRDDFRVARALEVIAAAERAPGE